MTANAMVFTDNPLFEGARKSVEYYLDRFRKGAFTHEDDNEHIAPQFKKHVWRFMKEGDPKSPRIMQLDDDSGEVKQFLLYYPADSAPYKDELVDKFKVARILSGEIWDQIEDKVYKQDDLVCLNPGDKFRPKTKDKECHIMVEVSNEMVKKNPNFIYRNCGDVK